MDLDDMEVDALCTQSANLLNDAFAAIKDPSKAPKILRRMSKIVNDTTAVIIRLEREEGWDPSNKVGGYSGTDFKPINAKFIMDLFTKYPDSSDKDNVSRLSTFLRAIPIGRLRKGTLSGALMISVNSLAISYLLLATPAEPLIRLSQYIFNNTEKSANISVIHAIGYFCLEIRRIWNEEIESNNDLNAKLQQLTAENNMYMASIFGSNRRRPFSGHYAVLARIVYGLEGNPIEMPNGSVTDIHKLAPFVLAVLDDLALGFKQEPAQLETRYNEFFKRLVYFDTYCNPSEAKWVFLGIFNESHYKSPCVPEDLYSRFSVNPDKRGTHMSIADFYLLASSYQTIIKAECEKTKTHPSRIVLLNRGRVKEEFSISNVSTTMNLLNKYNIVSEPNDKQLLFFKNLEYDTIYDKIQTDRDRSNKQSAAWANQDKPRAFNGENVILNPLFNGKLGGAAKKKKPASAASAAAKKKKTASAASAAAKKKKPEK